MVAGDASVGGDDVMTRNRLGALLCTLILAFVVGAAHAAELPLSAPSRATADVLERCADTSLAVVGSHGAGSVTVSEIPAACEGLPLTVWLRDRGATYHAGAVAPQGGGQLSVKPAGLALSTGAVALVTIDTWPMPTSFDVTDLPFVSCTTPDDPAVGCFAGISVTSQWGETWIRGGWVSTTSTDRVRWEVVINLSATELPFHPTNDLQDNEQGLVKVASSACDAEPRTVTVQGAGWGPYYMVSRDEPRRFQLEGKATAQGGNLLSCP